METYIVTVDGTAYEVTVEKKSAPQDKTGTLQPAAARKAPASAPQTAAEADALRITSGTSGKIWKITSAAGDQVKRGDAIVILEAMKMEIPVVAPEDGQVLSITVAEGDSVETGGLVALLKPQQVG